MTDCTFKSLLPHSTALEKQIEKEAHAKYCRNNPAIIKQMNDPWACPLEFLPWLAYSLSVDVWNDNWAEETKRGICDNAMYVHTNKGTLGGLEDALEALGIRMEIVEWWQQYQVEPGTINMTLFLNENILPNAEVLIGSELIHDLINQIDRNKRASIHYTFTLHVEMSTGISHAYSTESPSTLTRADAQQRSINTKPQNTGLLILYSAESPVVLTRVDAQQRSIKMNTKSAIYLAYSAGQLSTLTRLDMTV